MSPIYIQVPRRSAGENAYSLVFFHPELLMQNVVFGCTELLALILQWKREKERVD